VSRGGRVALALGAATLLGAWLFGSIPLVPVGVGLAAAGLAALGWRRLAGGVTLERRVTPRQVEGEPFRLDVRVHGARSLFGRVTVRERVGALGELTVPLRRGEGTLVVDVMPRGLYELGPASLVLEDPLGLERLTTSIESSERVWVRPRVVALDSLFGGGAGMALGGRARPVRSLGGLELYGIRDYHDGEPLRSVHWASTARRGQLMVRELEDPSRDQVAVVLDGDRAGNVGAPGESSFDEAVRVAAAVVHATARRGRRVRLVISAASVGVFRVGSTGGDWEAALDGLAAAVANGTTPVHVLLDGARGAAAGAAETVVVTARPSAMLERRLGGTRGSAVVVIDAPSYAGSERSGHDPTLLRLAGSGVAVAVVRKGDDLATALAGRSAERLGA
jgi:uncharacterized protein (DUF58 family)